MKKLIIAVLLLSSLALFASSCMSSGKMGCPTNVGSSKPFRA